MVIRNIVVTSANLMDIMTDKSVYVIKKGYFNDGYRMVAIGEADVKDVLSDDVVIIRIVE